MPDDIFSVDEAADELGLAPANVRLWILKGRLKAKKLGSTWAIARQDLEAFRTWWKANPRVIARKGTGQ